MVKKRIEYLDGIKGFSILLVVFCHNDFVRQSVLMFTIDCDNRGVAVYVCLDHAIYGECTHRAFDRWCDDLGFEGVVV